MKVKNNKGFTLLELLVAIFIFTTVIFIGYKIIDKSTIAITDQGNINKGQLTMNDMNNYLTKDLEQADKVEIDILNTSNEDKENLEKLDSEYSNFINDISETKLIRYTYTVKTKNDISETKFEDKKILSKYITTVEFNEEKYKYNISRIDFNNTKIEFISDRLLRNINKPPFIITGKSPYLVSVGYYNRNDDFNNHEFEVVSRLINSQHGSADEDIPWIPIEPSNPIIPEPPPVDEIIPPPSFGDYYVLGFWTADNIKKPKNNLYTWISEHGKVLKSAYETQDNRGNQRFNIQGKARPGNNSAAESYIGYKSIDTEYNSGWKAKIESSISDNDVSKISVFVSPYTKVTDFKIVATQGNAEIINYPSVLENGWTNIEINRKGGSKLNFEVSGNLSIDKNNVSSGYAYVVYERDDSNKQINGDIVYQFINRGKGQNNNQKRFDMELYSNVGNRKEKVNDPTQDIDENTIKNIDVIIKTDRQNEIHAQNIGGGISTQDNKFKDIKGVKIYLQGNLKIRNLKVFNEEIVNIEPNSSENFKMPLDPGQYHIKLDVVFDELQKDKPGKLIIDLIY